MKTVDLLIMNGIVVTMEGTGCGIIPDGAVAIQGNDIVAVGPTADVLKEYDGHRVFNAKNKVVMPGLIDCHAHSCDAIARGTAQDISGWMYKGIWPVLSCSDVEGKKIGSMVHLAESVLGGTTTICDMVYDSDTIVENHVQLGVRGFVSEMIHSMPPDVYKADENAPIEHDASIGNRRFQTGRKMVEQYNGYDNGRITCMLGPQAINMCSLELMDEIYGYARKNNVGITIHVSQGDRENVQIERRFHKRAIPLLDEKGYLGPDVLCVHLTCATPEEIATVVKSGSPMVLCSTSLAIIGGEIPPASEFLAAGGLVALGTDQAPGNNRNNMFSEMKMSALLNKCKHKQGTFFPAWQVLRMATVDAARALRKEKEIGSLRPGKKADVIIVDMQYPALTPILLSPIRNIIPNLVYSANGSEVETVIINGKVVVDDHQLTTIDLKQTIADANAAAQRFCGRLEHFDGLDQLPLAKWTREGLY